MTVGGDWINVLICCFQKLNNFNNFAQFLVPKTLQKSRKIMFTGSLKNQTSAVTDGGFNVAMLFVLSAVLIFFIPNFVQYIFDWWVHNIWPLQWIIPLSCNHSRNLKERHSISRVVISRSKKTHVIVEIRIPSFLLRSPMRRCHVEDQCSN